jgi:hypothetical protein
MLNMKKIITTNGAVLFLVFLIASACSQKHELATEKLTVNIGSDGQFISIEDNKTGVNYLEKEASSSLLTVRIEGVYHQPSSLAREGDFILLSYKDAGIDAKIKAEEKNSYLTFELTEITSPEKIEIVLWGPYKTTIRETVGETIGVVRNSEFAFGIQALNVRTLGGYPQSEDDGFTGYDIFSTTSLVDVADSVHILYRGHTAKPENYGSSLNAYTRNRGVERIVSTMSHEKYISPAFQDEGIVGSKIALFGCRPDEVLDVVEDIELTEGLPHPTLDGIWAKRSVQATAAYLIQDFSKDNYKAAIELTKKAGLKYLYHIDPFKTWGHFELRHNMSRDDLKMIVEAAENEGIKVGAHTLSNFITTNDAYVTPVPDPRLAKVGSSVLTGDITAKATSIGIEDPSWFNQMKNNSLHAVMIGTELVRYEKVSETAPWTLLNCERGVFGTTASSHQKGTAISKLADHAYKTFLTDNALSAEVSGRLAELYNKTGLKQISFDGLEGNYSTGMGSYGELLFVKNWYDRLEPEIKNNYIMDASRPGHYFWHMFTRMNWGEPWYAGFRESQTEYRLLNQDYFRRNYIPCMLGWFNMGAITSIEDIEWMLARSAAFDAGYALVTNADIIRQNGYGDQILEQIRQWEKARMNGAFNDDQKKRMENIKSEYTLETIGEDQWNLIPFEVKRYEHKYLQVQPGQPTFTTFNYNNPYNEQCPEFIITSVNSSASNISIEIDDFKKIDLNISIKPKEYLKYKGGNEVVLYSENWQKIKSLPVDPDKFRISNGDHSFKVDCSFTGTEGALLKLEIKTAGEPEEVKAR